MSSTFNLEANSMTQIALNEFINQKMYSFFSQSEELFPRDSHHRVKKYCHAQMNDCLDNKYSIYNHENVKIDCKYDLETDPIFIVIQLKFFELTKMMRMLGKRPTWTNVLAGLLKSIVNLELQCDAKLLDFTSNEAMCITDASKPFISVVAVKNKKAYILGKLNPDVFGKEVPNDELVKILGIPYSKMKIDAHYYQLITEEKVYAQEQYVFSFSLWFSAIINGHITQFEQIKLQDFRNGKYDNI